MPSTSEDFPDPETPASATSRPSGMATSKPLRLLARQSRTESRGVSFVTSRRAAGMGTRF